MLRIAVKYLLILAILSVCVQVQAEDAALYTVKVSNQPLNSGRISPMLYGSFIELWDDHVQGMWSEMLNDRNFEGVEKRADWNYYIGEPNICDREWDKNDTWAYDTTSPFNASRSACLTASKDKPAVLTQSGLATKKGLIYRFTGYFKADDHGFKVEASLKTLLPDDTWMTLGSSCIADNIGSNWTKISGQIPCKGTTDHAVFELKISGSGSVFVDKVSLMPSDNVKGWRKDAVAAISELGPPVVRWGGCVVDPGHYRWKQCVGDRDLRVPFHNDYWGRIDPNDVGIDEFLQFCEAVGAKPLICVSFADGAENARDLVHYCNDPATTEWGKKRAANGHEKPYSVDLWQLGNELEDENYINGYIDLCKSIKEADPKAVIFASFPSEKLLTQAGKYMDYICPHYYRDDFDNIEQEIKDIKLMLKRAAPGHDIKIASTEWNVTNPWGIDRGKIMTLYFALGNARFLNIWHRNSDYVQLSCRSNMCNSLNDGAIQTKPSGVLKTASYYVMKLYREHTKPLPMVLTGIPEGFDATACASDDKKSVCIFIINLTEQNKDFKLDLSEFGKSFAPIKAEALRDTKSYYQPDCMNTWLMPDRIKIAPVTIKDGIVTLPAYSVTAIECAAN